MMPTNKQKLFAISTILILTAPIYAKYEAHEWGTFTSVVDSTGVTQNGMYHEDEVLPNFVHPFGELRQEEPVSVVSPKLPPLPVLPKPCHSKVCFSADELKTNFITQKMETPVIYFYTDQKQTIKINVKFPQGIITETYPGPIATFPTMADPHIVGNGNTDFSVDVLPVKSGQIPFVEANNIYSHARNVNSNIIKSGAETEKFIFYRGIGRFQPKISIQSKSGGLKISNLAVSRPQMAVLIHVNQSGQAQMLSLDQIKTKNEISLSANTLLALKNHNNESYFLKGEQAKGKLVDALVSSGLYKDEAFAMVNTWENGYLKVPGLRLLYVLPRAEVDEILPLTMTPAPENLVRSFVGRMEILLDTEEANILKNISTERDQFQLQSLGRFAEPILHRIRKLAPDELIPLIDRLLINAAVNSLEVRSTVVQ